MAIDKLLRCVPDPSGGSGSSPCPVGYVATTLDVELPFTIAFNDWTEFASLGAFSVLSAWLIGFGIGLFARLLREGAR